MSQIKVIRIKLGLSQKAIANVMGCTQSNVSFYEGGQTVPPDAAKRLIAHAADAGLLLSFDHIYGDIELPDVAIVTQKEG